MEGRQAKRVLIIGVRGVLGVLTARAFTDAGWDVRGASRQPSPGQVQVDLDRLESVAATLREDELVVNTVPHPALLAERFVLEWGGTLINISALPAAAGRSLRAVAGGARGTVLMNAGLAPGVTTLVAADLLHRHPDARELEIVFTLSQHDSPRAGERRLHPSWPDRGRPAPDAAWSRCRLRSASAVASGLERARRAGSVASRRAASFVSTSASCEPGPHERMLELQQRRRDDDAAQVADPLEGAARWRRGQQRARRALDRRQPRRAAAGRAGPSSAAAIFCTRHAARSCSPRRCERRERQGGCFDPEEICTLGGLESKLRAAGITIVPQTGRAGEQHDGAGDYVTGAIAAVIWSIPLAEQQSDQVVERVFVVGVVVAVRELCLEPAQESSVQVVSVSHRT